MATSCHYRFPPTLILKSSLSREASKKHMFEETMIVETEGLQWCGNLHSQKLKI